MSTKHMHRNSSEDTWRLQLAVALIAHTGICYHVLLTGDRGSVKGQPVTWQRAREVPSSSGVLTVSLVSFLFRHSTRMFRLVKFGYKE